MVLTITTAILIGLISSTLGIVISLVRRNYSAAAWAFCAFSWCLNSAFK